MFPYLRLGPFLLQIPLLALLIGLWLGLTFIEREAVRLGLNKEKISSLVFYGLIGGIVSARLAYAAQYASAYLSNPSSLLSLNTNTLSPETGLFFGVLVAGIYAYRQKLPIRNSLDALAPGLAFFMVMIGASHLLSGDSYGAATRVPWAVYLWSDYRHPTQLYEIFFALMIFTIILSRIIPANAPGLRFIHFIGLSVIARVFIEAFRGDSVVLFDGYRAAQVFGLAILVVCLALLRRWEGKDQHESKIA
jgi:phosphatidylglycerol:prolipoprotein diacylglycerol transferase